MYRVLSCWCVLFLPVTGFAQEAAAPAVSTTAANEEVTSNKATIPSGTKVLMVMKNTVTSKNARQGDGVYLETTFPVVEGGRVVIPAGTYVQGVVDSVRRSGRVKGRAEILLHFTTLIYPNGYTLLLPGALNSADGNDGQRVKDEEGTVQADGSKGRDTATVATTAGTGAVIGGLSRGGKGAAVGGGIGAAVGVATAMFTRGDEVRLASGTSVEMVLQRPVVVDMDRIEGTNRRSNAPASPSPAKKPERPTLTVPSPGPIVR
jgi:type IV secretion system protein VirB10